MPPALELREKRRGMAARGRSSWPPPDTPSSARVVWRAGRRADAAYGVNLMEGQVDADVLELDTDSGKTALRVVDAKTTVGAVFDGDTLTGLTVAARLRPIWPRRPEGFSDWDGALLEELRSALEETERAGWRRCWTCPGRWRPTFWG